MTQRRLVLLLVLFFVALALPTSVLVYQAYGQLKWEAFYQHQRLARELTLRIDGEFRDLIEREENRPISDYEFLNVSGSEGSAFLQPSPLSRFPVEVELPGLLGFFQVDSAGQLRTPIVPDANASAYGISPIELEQRQQQEAPAEDHAEQVRRVHGRLPRGRSRSGHGKYSLPAPPAAPPIRVELRLFGLREQVRASGVASSLRGVAPLLAGD